jgi:hypothetical protein
VGINVFFFKGEISSLFDKEIEKLLQFSFPSVNSINFALFGGLYLTKF